MAGHRTLARGTEKAQFWSMEQLGVHIDATMQDEVPKKFTTLYHASNNQDRKLSFLITSMFYIDDIAVLYQIKANRFAMLMLKIFKITILTSFGGKFACCSKFENFP